MNTQIKQMFPQATTFGNNLLIKSKRSWGKSLKNIFKPQLDLLLKEFLVINPEYGEGKTRHGKPVVWFRCTVNKK
jgi:hypothetical protein